VLIIDDQDSRRRIQVAYDGHEFCKNQVNLWQMGRYEMRLRTAGNGAQGYARHPVMMDEPLARKIIYKPKDSGRSAPKVTKGWENAPSLNGCASHLHPSHISCRGMTLHR
jgi:hypothetical protein